MSLPDAWVNRLFAKLSVTYGQGFLRQYDGVEIEAVKANWAEELSCFQQSPDSIRYGLEYLPPSKAPTVLEFRDLCRKAPAVTLALPAPSEPADPAVIARAKTAFRALGTAGNRGWAEKLRERERLGKGLTRFQRDAWREVLGVEQPESME